MSLFSDLSGYKATKVMPKSEPKKKKQPTLKELAEEKFGDDRQLIMWIDSFLEQKREAHCLPSRIAWLQQLAALEEWPTFERVNQVRRSITNDYRALAYPPKRKFVPKAQVSEYELEENMQFERGF